MAEIILPPEENEETPQAPEVNIDKPTENSKVITIEFEAKKTNKVSTKDTNQQLYTTDTDAWFEFKETSLEGANGTYSVVFRNRHDGSIFQRTGDVVSGVAYYKIPQQEIRHAGAWRGQIVYTLSNGDTTSREFGYDVKGHILDGKDVREIVVEDFETLMSQLRSMKDSAELELANLVNTANQNEANRQAFFDDLIEDIDELQANYQELLDTGVLQTNINTKLEALEEEYAPQLTEVTTQLAQNVENVNSQQINVLYPPKPLQSAKGDGVTDDTVAIQAIINYAKIARMTVLFPPATYMIKTVYLYPGLTLLGYGATIKRPENMGEWTRTFSMPESGDYMWGGDRDSELLTIKGFTFDGNSANQGDYSNHKLQHAHLIFLSADHTKAGKLRSHIEDCVFRNCVGDGISIHRNQDSKITNCVAENCYRGGIVLTGGYTDLQITNFKAKGDIDRTGIDFEVDGRGYGDTYKTNITINGMILDNGDFDVDISDGSTLTATNIQSYKSPFMIVSLDARIKISNSLFYVGHESVSDSVVYPHNVTFNNCDFVVYKRPNSEPNTYACIRVLFNTLGLTRTNQSLTLIDCDFRVDSSILETDTTFAILIDGDGHEGNTVNVLGGNIPKEFDFGIATKQGFSNLFVKDTKIDAKTSFRLWFSELFPLQTVIDSVQILQNVGTYMDFPDSNDKSLTSHKNVVMSNEQNVITSRYPLSINKYFGGRIIYGDESPITTSTAGFVGDTFRLNNPVANSPYEWVCITSHKTQATWKESKTLGA